MTDANLTPNTTETTDAETSQRDAGRKAQQGAWGLAVLFGLGNTKRHVYGGTVAWETKQGRRAKNRAARKSRRINRRRGA